MEGHELTALIIEDDYTGYYYLKEALGLAGVKSVWVNNAVDGFVYCLKQKQPDCVFMDIKLPRISGLDGTHLIKKYRPKIPVIAETAFIRDQDKDICFRAGCDAYLYKPISNLKLMDTVNAILKVTRPEFQNITIEKA
jgi:CheY-like chemotaxis protein